MRTQFLDGVEFALELFFCQHLMNLRMTRAANADDGAHMGTRKVALVPFVVMAGSRN
jgi:hypothetical protein